MALYLTHTLIRNLEQSLWSASILEVSLWMVWRLDSRLCRDLTR